jgi:hypothetical protein
MIAVISFIASRTQGCCGRACRLSSCRRPALAPHRKCIFYADRRRNGFVAARRSRSARQIAVSRRRIIQRERFSRNALALRPAPYWCGAQGVLLQ